MTRYEVTIATEDHFQVVIECRSKKHAIEVFRALNRAKCSLVDLEDLSETFNPLKTMAINGHGPFMGDDDAWIVLGMNTTNKKRIDFEHPEKGMEYLGSVAI